MTERTRMVPARPPGIRWQRLLDGFPTGVTLSLGFGVLIVLYFPIVWLMLMSLSGEPLSGVPGDWTFQWYSDLLQGAGAQRTSEAYGNQFFVREPMLLSLILGGMTAVFCMAASVVVGSVLPRVKTRGPFLLGFLIPLMVPGVVAGVSLFLYYRIIVDVKMGIWSLSLAHFVWAFPFALLAMLVVTSRFDSRLLDAAADLGANRWRRFRDIEVPILKPGIFAAGFFGFLLSFNELPFSIFMRSGQLTLPIYLWIQSGAHNSSVPLIFSLSALITIVSIVLTFIAIRLAFGQKSAKSENVRKKQRGAGADL